MVKLTLSVNEDVLEKAKQVAEANHTSVSAMFTQFVRSLGRPHGKPKVGPLTKKLSGVVKLSPRKDYKEQLTDALVEKYGPAE